jgi:MFS family permease
MTLAPTLISLNQYGKYMAIFSTLFIVANVLGPVLGGVISQHSDWRWVFLLKLVANAFYTVGELLIRPL